MESLEDILSRDKALPQSLPPLLPSASERPPGCWCEGKGGGRKEVISFSSGIVGVPGEVVEVWRETCICPEGLAAEKYKSLQRQRKDEEEDRHAKAIVWRKAGIPSRFEQFRLSSSPLALTNPKLIGSLTYPFWTEELGQDGHGVEMEEWMNKTDFWGGSWFFWGAFGTGKTGLAIGYTWEWIQNEWGLLSTKPVLFRTVPRLMTELRATYNRERDSETPTEEQLLKQFNEASLLVRDALGAAQVCNTGWLEDRLYQIIGERHDNERPTIFTSNMSLEELAGRIGERVTWRIVEMCGKERIVHIEGPNLRL